MTYTQQRLRTLERSVAGAGRTDAAETLAACGIEFALADSGAA